VPRPIVGLLAAVWAIATCLAGLVHGPGSRLVAQRLPLVHLPMDDPHKRSSGLRASKQTHHRDESGR
jgi:hypothetical protein